MKTKHCTWIRNSGEERGMHQTYFFSDSRKNIFERRRKKSLWNFESLAPTKYCFLIAFRSLRFGSKPKTFYLLILMQGCPYCIFADFFGRKEAVSYPPSVFTPPHCSCLIKKRSQIPNIIEKCNKFFCCLCLPCPAITNSYVFYSLE